MRPALALLIPLFLLLGCMRTLSPGEEQLAAELFGPTLDPEPVRVAPFTSIKRVANRRPPRPRVACRERIWPEPEQKEGLVETFTAAFVTWNRINVNGKLYQDDFLPDHPERISLPDAMLIAHEMTHVWQWQNRAVTGYTPQKALSEHEYGKDPYLITLDDNRRFLDFPYEQQGAIVEEYVCCRMLDPEGDRTKRLHALLSGAFPVSDLGKRLSGVEVRIPWKDAETEGICG